MMDQYKVILCTLGTVTEPKIIILGKYRCSGTVFYGGTAYVYYTTLYSS